MARQALIRADASLAIGTGHVQRCLTLARALRDQGGWKVSFASRGFAGHLNAFVAEQGFGVAALPDDPGLLQVPLDAWPVAAVKQDAAATRAVIGQVQPDLIIVDHYALQAGWHAATQAPGMARMAITDLYDQDQPVGLLLNQNLGASAARYRGHVPADCQVLAGPEFALLRPEFASARPAALARRAGAQAGLPRLLIALGGVDADNVTGWLLQVIGQHGLQRDWAIDVVLGGGAPHRDAVAAALAGLGGAATRLIIDSRAMATLMAAADLAIGAGGGTMWERCALGLPTLLVVLAENQRAGAMALAATGAAAVVPIGDAPGLAMRLTALRDSGPREPMAVAAAAVCDGAGAVRVMAAIHQMVG
ncbi:MAG: UDP-2,4-diacetamido-2,4,6-trideoxy-beta-L-altropyranose hydrolase [Rhodobacteraceae bacterium]|nr:UDP-2,4-diacetamido-2,4,6-trideoxy-beta-L-altropyranose hydrolase [Paracoccaceae bacterium]